VSRAYSSQRLCFQASRGKQRSDERRAEAEKKKKKRKKKDWVGINSRTLEQHWLSHDDRRSSEGRQDSKERFRK
jgi:hypothetical protein